MNDEVNDELERYVDLLTVWQIRQRSRALERAVAEPSEVHVFDRPEAVVVASASAKQAKGIAHERRQQDDDDDDVPAHLQTSRRKGTRASQRALENQNGRHPEDRR